MSYKCDKVRCFKIHRRAFSEIILLEKPSACTTLGCGKYAKVAAISVVQKAESELEDTELRSHDKQSVHRVNRL